MSNAAFKRNFAKLMARAGDRADDVARLMVIAIAKGCVMKSPVDTGRFRGNWQFGVNSANVDVGSPNDKGGAGALNRVAAGVNVPLNGQTFYITNSLPYARRLEYGHSKQAPQGMVRLTLREMNTYLRKAVGSSK